MNLNIRLEDVPDPENIQLIERQLKSYNLQYAEDDGYSPLVIFARDHDNNLVGGLLGETYWGWLHIRILWIDEHFRGQKYGSRILHMAEREAVQRGCLKAHLDTMSFQAVSFYERHGYSTFGFLEDFPRGYSRHFMMKNLSTVSQIG